MMKTPLKLLIGTTAFLALTSLLGKSGTDASEDEGEPKPEGDEEDPA